MVFLGEFHHSLDEKGRIILPSKYREPLSRGAIISKGDGCLFIYTLEEFEQVANEIREKAKSSSRLREAARSFFAGASDATPDKQGRLTLPNQLRTYAKLKKEVTVLGVYSRIEIWDDASWNSRSAEGDASLNDTGSLPDLGI